MEWLFDILQWSAMAITLLSAWLVASTAKLKRNVGFWTFILSNFMWAVWGWHSHAYALIVLQIGLLFLNIRGALKNSP